MITGIDLISRGSGVLLLSARRSLMRLGGRKHATRVDDISLYSAVVCFLFYLSSIVGRRQEFCCI